LPCRFSRAKAPLPSKSSGRGWPKR
jgi:hypothetical protein